MLRHQSINPVVVVFEAHSGAQNNYSRRPLCAAATGCTSRFGDKNHLTLREQPLRFRSSVGEGLPSFLRLELVEHSSCDMTWHRRETDVKVGVTLDRGPPRGQTSAPTYRDIVAGRLPSQVSDGFALRRGQQALGIRAPALYGSPE